METSTSKDTAELKNASRRDAMKPGKGFWAVVLTLLSVIPVAAFLKSVHQQITQNVLGTACRTIDNKTLCFTARAIGEVSDANRDTDSIFGQNDASRHFDSEA